MRSDVDLKKDVKIINNLLNGILKQSRKEVFFKELSSYTFQDGFNLKSTPYHKIILLELNNIPVGLLGFSIFEKKIKITGIQGIKNNTIVSNPKYYKYLLDAFIKSSLIVYKTPENFKNNVVYSDLNKIVKDIIQRDLLIYAVNAFKRDQKLTLSNFNFFILNNEKEINILNHKIRQLKIVGSKYFNNDGTFNFDKKAVREIVLDYKTYLSKKKITFKKYSTLKKKFPIRRIK